MASKLGTKQKMNKLMKILQERFPGEFNWLSVELRLEGHPGFLREEYVAYAGIYLPELSGRTAGLRIAGTYEELLAALPTEVLVND